MAIDTPESWRDLVIYEVYVRDHGPRGTFQEVDADLKRIRDLGVDVVWFMPIHPIGKLNKKGGLGCPYSIADYEETNPEYGSKAEFKNLVEHAHQLGLKVMIDVVYNHTSHDSRLVREHPDWFHQDENGKPVTTVPDWSDVIDLKYAHESLEDYLIGVLKDWALLGVDGFRCDVASIVPMRMWERARREVAAVKPGVIWLAESVHLGFVEYRRNKGLSAVSDSELYQAFDMLYDYEIWPVWQAAVLGKVKVGDYLQMLRFQSGMYPRNYIKMRCVENHDQERIMSVAPSKKQALAWTAFSAFLPGAFLIYAGQESGATVRPTLFDRDPLQWKNYSLSPFLCKLTALKKNELQRNGIFTILEDEPFIRAAWSSTEKSLYGVFNCLGKAGNVDVHLPDGKYRDLISTNVFAVIKGQMKAPETACILDVPAPVEMRPFYNNLIDFQLK